MKYTAQDERQTASPGRNGMIERSHRTDHEELFEQMRFSSLEQRCYYLKLWEYEYNYQRPDQGIGNQTPMQLYRQNDAMHAAPRLLTF